MDPVLRLSSYILPQLLTIIAFMAVMLDLITSHRFWPSVSMIYIASVQIISIDFPCAFCILSASTILVRIVSTSLKPRSFEISLSRILTPIVLWGWSISLAIFSPIFNVLFKYWLQYWYK